MHHFILFYKIFRCNFLCVSGFDVRTESRAAFDTQAKPIVKSKYKDNNWSAFEFHEKFMSINHSIRKLNDKITCIAYTEHKPRSDVNHKTSWTVKHCLFSFFLSLISFFFRQIHIESKFLQTGPSSSPSKYKSCLKILNTFGMLKFTLFVSFYVKSSPRRSAKTAPKIISANNYNVVRSMCAFLLWRV